MAYGQEQSATDFRVGLMTFTALCLVILGITFAGGDKGLLFAPVSVVKARLADVGGLKKGSAVTIGGMPIGKVMGISFAESGDLPKIEVVMNVRNDMRGRIKKDSLPVVKTQGMLGDRYLELVMGSAESPTLGENESLIGSAASDFDKTMSEANNALAQTTKMLAAINQKEGTAGQFIYDREFYENLTKITEELNELIKDFKEHPRKYIKFSMF
jgi:phospholipid/cholesterol/gamma-HCH transport system substrate-binding protein